MSAANERASLRRDVSKPRAQAQRERSEADSRTRRADIKIGIVLLDFQNSKAYQPEYPSFKDYVRRRLGLSKFRVRQLIKSAQVSINLSSTGLPTPSHEAQVRSIQGLSPELQREIWQIVTQGNPCPSQREVEFVTRTVLKLRKGEGK